MYSKKRKQTLTIACSILLSMATTLAPEELKNKSKEAVINQRITNNIGYIGFCMLYSQLNAQNILL